MSKKVERFIQLHESILEEFRYLINEKGETTQEVQQVIDQALDELAAWYEFREQFK